MNKVRMLESLATITMAAAAVVVAVSVVMANRAGSRPPSGDSVDRRLNPSQWQALLAAGSSQVSGSAPATLIVFADFQCPACGGFAREVLPRIKVRFGDKVTVLFRHWPLSYHPMARPLAIAAECAARQDAFWSFHDHAFGAQQELGRLSIDSLAKAAGVGDSAAFVACRESEAVRELIDRDVALAEKIGAPGTPAIVLNGTLLGSGGREAPLTDAITKEIAKHSGE